MGDFVMGDQFRGLPMGDLIGGPLMAACDAQVRLANSTANFIQTIGFVPKPNQTLSPDTMGKISQDQLDVRTVDFRFDRPAAPDANGDPQTETVSLEVPLLAIVKVPSLFIDTVDITFDMSVTNTETSTSGSAQSGSFNADASIGWGIFSLKVHVEGSVSTHQENTRSTDQSAKYHVQVHAVDKGMPEGLARVFDIMNQAIAPKSIGPAKKVTGTTGGTTAAGGATGTTATGTPGHDTIQRGLPASSVVLDHADDDGATVLKPGRYEVVDA